MERRKFLQQSCKALLVVPLGAGLASCEGLYYVAEHSYKDGVVSIPLSEFEIVKEGKSKKRKFVLYKSEKFQFPICVYRTGKNEYVSSLMECTHQGCELNVAGGAYSCPCHGSEFSTQGKVLEGPAEYDLKTFETKTDEKYIYINV